MPLLNYLLANPRRLLVAVLTLLALASAASYLAPSCERRKDKQLLAAHKAERQQAEATGQQRDAAYNRQALIDSMNQVCTAKYGAALAKQDEALTRRRRPLVLPAASDLPCEGAN